MLGFTIGKGCRIPDPKKTEQLRNWPPYESCADIVSHLYFASYLREFLGPDFVELTEPLHRYRKKDADFSQYKTDKAAHESRKWLISQTLDKAVLVQPDWAAAARPWESGRPFLIMIDASNIAWCVALCQQDRVGGPPRIIAFISRGFDKVAQNWSAFEREFAGLRDGYDAVKNYVEGFEVFVLFDHKNLERAEVVIHNRRASKKLINWVADCILMLATIHRLWIDGKFNVITDTGSRAGWIDLVARRVVLPIQSVLDTIRSLFTAPQQLEKQCEERNKQLNLPPWEGVARDAVELRYLPLEESEPTPFKEAEMMGQSSSFTSFQSGETCTGWKDPYARDQTRDDENDRVFAGEVPKPTIPPCQKKDYKGEYPICKPEEPVGGQLWIVDEEMSETNASTGGKSFVTAEDSPQVNDAGVQSEPSVNPGSKPARLFSDVDDRRDDFKRSRINALSIGNVGMNVGADFFEVCGGSEGLSSHARLGGLTVLEGETLRPPQDPNSEDKREGCDVSSKSSLRRIKGKISKSRPLHTHLSPECRVFSQMYNPSHDERLDENFWTDMDLADNILELAMHIHREGLYGLIEIPRGATRFWKLEKAIQLGRLPGWFYIDLDGCMFDMKHPVTDKHVKKGWRFLTNSWYLTPVGIICDNSHDHTKIEGVWTNWSGLYPTLLCESYIRYVKEGRKALVERRKCVSAVSTHGIFDVIDTGRGIGRYPSTPLAFPRNDINLYWKDDTVVNAVDSTFDKRISMLVDEDDDDEPDPIPAGPDVGEIDEQQQPVHVPVEGISLKDLGLSERDKTEYETLIKLVVSQKVPIVKITHGMRVDGREEYTVRFQGTIYSSIRQRDVDTLSIPCRRSFQSEGLGHENASIIMHYMLKASNNLLEQGQFGVGAIKSDGFHGNPGGIFYIHEPECSTKDWWNHHHDTIVDREVFCRNSSLVRTTRTGSKQCKCHGHPINDLPGSDDPLHYADGTKQATRVRANEFLDSVKTAVEGIFIGAPQDFLFGFSDADYALWPTESPEQELAVQLLGQFFWSTKRQPCTTIFISNKDNPLDANDRHEGYLTAWSTVNRASVHYKTYAQKDDGDYDDECLEEGQLEMKSPIPFHGSKRIHFPNNTVRVAFLCAALENEDEKEAYAPFKTSLENMGLPVPSSKRTNSLVEAITALGIERDRFTELLRLGADTRATTALFWWFSGEASNFKDLYHVEPEEETEADHDERLELVDRLDEEEPGDPLERPGVPEDSCMLNITVDGKACKLSKADLVRIRQATQIPLEDFKVALKHAQEYRWYYGLLQRKMYNSQNGLFEWYSVIPDGGWKSVEFQGKTRRYSLRKYIVLIMHDSPLGGHRDRDRTMEAIRDAALWWSNMRVHVDSHIRSCLQCRYAKGQTLITGHMRSREIEGPFRVLVMDFVGPMYPKTARGHLYMFTVICPFSGWYWAIPTVDSEGLTAARTFAERVMLDVAGVPVMLCSDRARVFVFGVIQYLNDTFGIKGVLGSSIHPESQGAVESPHRVYKTMCKQFMKDFEGQWDIIAPMFQWTIRSSAKIYNAKFTPYEIITGMKPRLPLDAVLSTPSVIHKQSVDQYVTNLVVYLKKVHKFIQEEHRRVREHEGDYRIRHHSLGEFKEGDYVMLKSWRKPEKGVSSRFQHGTDTRLFQIMHAPGDLGSARTVTLMDPATGKTNFEFAQPVSTDRLVPVEMLPLTRPHNERTAIISGNKRSEITATCIDGRVHVKWEDQPETEIVDCRRIPHEFTF